MPARDQQISYRPAVPADEPFLERMLWLAFHWRDETADPDSWLEPAVPQKYVSGFGRAGDGGVIAERAGEPVGAAWYRLQPPSDPGYGYVGPDVPELGIAVTAGVRGQGVATELLSRLLAQAQAAGLPALSLSVEPDNPALRLYQRLGFTKVGEVGGSWTMVRRLAAGAPSARE